MVEDSEVVDEGLRIANDADISALVDLVNRAYRPTEGASGWTHESELVNGQRINASQARYLIGQPDSFVLVQEHRGELTGCVHVKKEGSSCHIGMLAVSPAIQGQGAGKRLLERAERHAVREFGSSQFVLDVITTREGLLSFYLRRGYYRTGMVYRYPLEAGAGVPLCPNLYVEVLAKCASVA